MKLVCNASPLIALAKAGILDILHVLADKVVVAEAVVNKVIAGASADPGRRALSETPWLERVVLDPPVSQLAAIHLGKGEAEVIEWAARHTGYTAILDDRAARRAAKALGVEYAGTLRVIFEACQRGLLPSFSDAVERLQRAGLYCDEATIGRVGDSQES